MCVHAARNDWCPATVNNNFGNTTTVSSVYSRAVGASMRLICKPTGLGRNWKGNGTSIVVYCDSLADGSGGVWVSDDWCCMLVFFAYSRDSLFRILKRIASALDVLCCSFKYGCVLACSGRARRVREPRGARSRGRRRSALQALLLSDPPILHLSFHAPLLNFFALLNFACSLLAIRHSQVQSSDR